MNVTNDLEKIVCKGCEFQIPCIKRGKTFHCLAFRIMHRLALKGDLELETIRTYDELISLAGVNICRVETFKPNDWTTW